jgi:hypothetical protein
LIVKYLKTEGFRLRMRGWAKWALRNRRGGKKTTEHLRLFRVFHKGSPRTLIYACAALLYFTVPIDSTENDSVAYPENLTMIRGLLPAPPISLKDDWFSASKRVVKTWQEHVKNG